MRARSGGVIAAGVYADPARVAWRIAGPGALRALHGLLTNDLLGPGAGAAIPCFVLDPRGRPLADVRVLKIGAEDLVLDLPAAARESLAGHFARYLPPRLARVEPLEGAVLLRLVGPLAADLAGAVFGEDLPIPAPDRFEMLPAGPGGGTEGFLIGRAHEEGGGLDMLLARPRDVPRRLEEAARARGGSGMGADAWDAWRVERGIPLYGKDFDAGNLPQETGLVARMVSFDKGCYTGQEVVARIHYRGHVNRHLRGLRFPAAAGVEPGASLYAAGREVGHVTSAVRTTDHGPIGLGLLRREISPGDRVALAADAEATVQIVTVPFT